MNHALYSKVTLIAAVACKNFPHKRISPYTTHLFVCFLHLIAISVVRHYYHSSVKRIDMKGNQRIVSISHWSETVYIVKCKPT